ncbi:GNAT family N-acetyltransferase [Sphingobacteriaceae bacterium]|nr:GNAT family N-acetyltransferase [Sphingobacteriaceae bacterium]
MGSETRIRTYTAEDKQQVLNLLRLNTPRYFAPEEEKDFSYYLENELEYYFVLEYEESIVGCGGFNFSGNAAVGKISWDIFHPDYQGKSLGSTLFDYRLKKLEEFTELKTIIVRTTQLVYKFYEKKGFELMEVIENYWAPGLDLYKMNYNPTLRR